MKSINHNKSALTYKDAGVNIEAASAFIENIKPIAQKTRRPEVLQGLGGFGALFELPWQRYQQPVLVSTTDGVGTKLKLAIELEKHDTIGIDLVAMCVNDLIVQGAEPLFFLDYFASGRLDIETASEIMRGIGKGCEQAGAALIGGETAEMPGLYHHHDYDLAGFSVGIVEKSRLIDGSKTVVGDSIIGIASSGLHSNGFSLVRKILDRNKINLSESFGQKTLGETLLTPTQIYVKPLLQLLMSEEIHAIAHITGGGLLENLPRVLPKHTRAFIHGETWKKPDIFSWLQTEGQISWQEMYRTFNCGIGMTLCVPTDRASSCIELLHQLGELAWEIGTVQASENAPPQVIIDSL